MKRIYAVRSQDKRTMGREMTGKSPLKGFWDTSDILFLDPVASCMNVFSW